MWYQSQPAAAPSDRPLREEEFAKSLKATLGEGREVKRPSFTHKGMLELGRREKDATLLSLACNQESTGRKKNYVEGCERMF